MRSGIDSYGMCIFAYEDVAKLYRCGRIRDVKRRKRAAFRRDIEPLQARVGRQHVRVASNRLRVENPPGRQIDGQKPVVFIAGHISDTGSFREPEAMRMVGPGKREPFDEAVLSWIDDGELVARL